MKGKYYSDRAAKAANQNIKEKEYWLKTLSNDPVKSRFTIDNGGIQKEESENRKMKVESFRFSPVLSSKSIKVSSGIDLELHMILVAGLVGLLEKYTATSDIIIGSPILKQDMEAEFISTFLVLRIRLTASMTFKELLVQVKETIVNATKNQNFPLEVLPDLLNMPVFRDEFPLFDVALLLQNVHDKSYLEGIHYNMLFSFNRLEDGIEGSLEYNSLLYQKRTVKQIISHYTSLLEKGLSNLNLRLADIDILSEQEKYRLLKEFNDTRTDYPKGKTIHRLFEEQLERAPDNIAVVGIDHGAWGMVSLTYRELNRKSNHLAALLIKKGVSSGDIVAIMVERSAEMVIGLLAVLKAGGAYLPLSPDYPEERKRYMLADSNVEILLLDCKDQGTYEAEAVDITDPGIFCGESEYSDSTGAHSMAYVIYTSGSTGEPKGVMVEHHSVVRLVKHTNYLAFREGERILQTGALEFDASTFEIWGALLNGLQLHVAAKDVILVPERLKTTIQQNNITTMWMTSPLFNQMLQADMYIFGGLKNLLVGGDVLSLPHINTLRRRFPNLNIINGYGPTENTTFSTTFSIKKEYTHSIPIGSPISNSTVYIVGKDNHLVPVGIYGEILVGGDGVARGYLNNPDLTAEKFK